MILDILPNSNNSCQGETYQDCSHPKPISVARFQTFANNALYFTARSKTLGEDYVNLQSESKLIWLKRSKRHNRYKDDLAQQRKNELDKYTACSLWLEDIECSLGWHKCPIPKLWSTYKQEEYLVHHDGTVTVWAVIGGVSQQVSNTTIEELKKRCNARLDIIRKLQHAAQKPKTFGEPHKKTEFGKKARRSLLEAGAVVDNLCGKNSWVVTLTLPGNTRKAKDALANYSSYILNRLLQVPRRVKKPVYVFSVWEWQGRGALHLHISVSARPEDLSMIELKMICYDIKNKWYQVLLEMIATKAITRGNWTGNLPGVDMFERSGSSKYKHETWRYSPEVWKKGWDIQPIKKSVAKYFAKYASKNAKSGNKFEIQKGLNPSRWWSCNKPIKEEIKNFRYDYTVGYTEGETEGMLESIFEVYPPLMSYDYDFHIKAKSYKVIEGETPVLCLDSETSVTVCNGNTKIYYWKPEVFPEVCQLIRELKSTFSEIGHYRQSKPIDTLIK